MVDIWGAIRDTAESIGGSALAPAGVVWDLASAPFDDDEDSIADLLKSPVKRTSQFLDPILNTDTITGKSATEVMEAANWLLDNGVNRPLSTFFTNVQQATNEDSVGGRVGAMFSADDWARAWKMSDDQNAGQALATQVLSTRVGQDYEIDPFDYEDPYEEYTHPEHGAAASLLSWSANISGAFLLDPTALAGKGLGAARMASMADGFGMGKLSPAQKAELGTLLNSGSKADTRITGWSDWVAKNNKLGRPLTGPEILAATPELKKWGREPHVVASLIAEASKIGDDAVRRNTVKDIIAVAGGDQAALESLKAQRAAIPAMADALKNMRRGNVLDLTRVAANPDLAHNPLFVKHFESQLGRLNSDKAIDKMMDSWAGRLDLMTGTQGTLGNVPGRHLSSGRAVKRFNDQEATAPESLKDALTRGGALRAPRNVHLYAEQKTDDWLKRHFDPKAPKATLIQKGAYYAPLMVVKTGSFALAPYTKAPVSISDALRQTHFIPTVNTHDWGGATTQLDSMMKISHVPTLKRAEIIGRAGLLGDNEMAKQALIDEVERESFAALAKRYSERAGHEIDRGYIDTLMQDFSAKRGKHLAQLHGRAYAATQAPEAVAAKLDESAMAGRERGMAAAEDAVARGASRDKFSAEMPEGVNWRVDMIADDSGLPVSLPLLSSQLANQIPLMDVHLAKMLLKRDTSKLSTLSKAWRAEADELDGLMSKRATAKGKAAVKLDRAIEARRAAADWLQQAGQSTLRAWKMSVLFRLGYPARVIMDDHWRIWSQIGAGTFYADNLPEAVKNYRYNQPWWRGGNTGGRQGAARTERARLRAELESLRDELDSDVLKHYPARAEEYTKLSRSTSGLKGQITRARAQMSEEGADTAALQKRIESWERRIAENEAAAENLQRLMGERTPEVVNKDLELVRQRLAAANQSLDNVMPEKRGLGQADLDLGDVTLPGAFAGGQGAAARALSSSDDTFKYELRGVEESYYGKARPTAHVTIPNDNPGHLHAWADVLNNQFRNSPEAMFFLRGGTVDEFVAWVKAPEQAALRRRLPHYAHDPEDWGMRIESMIGDYVPTSQLRDIIAKGGSVKARDLDKMFPDSMARPMVHGAQVGDTLGTSGWAGGVGRTVNRAFEMLATMPTDRLSRHPFFNSLYKQHAKELADLKRAHKAKTGAQFTADDVAEITTQARKLALGDLKHTLYDLSAHSHAAHVMRFLSPFMAAHQEVLARWWRLVSENPGLVRRLQQAFDAPRYAGLTVDENGEPVPPGAPISKDHRIMLPLPWGDKNWSINENSFNLILQGGITNPGVGPLVTVPVEELVRRYPEDDDIRRVARVFNPYPPNSPMESALPATLKRALAVTEGATGFDIGGIGNREFNDLLATNINDAYVDFHLKMGREPSKSEAAALMVDAKRESLVEAMFKFANNAFSPFPARPSSKYAAIQRAAWQFREEGRQKFRTPDGDVDFIAANEWAYTAFREKYGEAYLALFHSDVNNEAGLAGTPSEVRAYKRHQALAQSLDPRLTRAVIGPEIQEGQDIQPEARNFFESTPIAVGVDKKLISNMDPGEMAYENMVRRGWQKYGELTASLTAMAQQYGLASYEDSDTLVAYRKAAIEKLREENYAWGEDYLDGPDGTYDEVLTDLRTLASSPLAKDPTRGDLSVLGQYLALRDQFAEVFKYRMAQGLGGPEAQSSEPYRALYRQRVGQLVESNTNFESYIYNGVIERDPWLKEAE